MDFSLIFFGLFFPIFSLIGAYLLRKSWRLGIASQDWPTAEGRFVESRFESNSDGYELIIKYEYSVKGHDFQGDTYSYRGFSTDMASLEEITNRYPVNSKVKVYFDPKSAKTSLLEPGVDLSAYIIAIVLLCVFFGAGVCCFSYGIWSVFNNG